MKKLTLPKQILSAVLAVVLTAGLGTAALASSEPIRPSDAPAARISDSESLPDARPSGEQPPEKPEDHAVPSGDPGASQEPSDRNAPAENGEPGVPSGEPNGQNTPADRTDASGEPARRLDVMDLLRTLLQRLQGLFAPRQDTPAARVSPAFQSRPQPASDETGSGEPSAEEAGTAADAADTADAA